MNNKTYSLNAPEITGFRSFLPGTEDGRPNVYFLLCHNITGTEWVAMTLLCHPILEGTSMLFQPTGLPESEQMMQQ